MAGFKINKFSAAINQTGVISTSKFLVEIPTSHTLFGPTPAGPRSSMEFLSFRAESVQLPGVTLETLNTNRYGVGPSQKFPINVTYSDVTISFIESRDLVIWQHMHDWMNSIFDFQGSIGGTINPRYQLEYKNRYAVPLSVHVFNDEGRRITTSGPDVGRLMSDQESIEEANKEAEATCTVVMKEAYPVSTNYVSLNWNDSNSLFKTTVVFTFSEWYLDSFISSRRLFGVTPTLTEDSKDLPRLREPLMHAPTFFPNVPFSHLISPSS